MKKGNVLIPVIMSSLTAIMLAGCCAINQRPETSYGDQVITANYLQTPEQTQGWLKDDYYVREWLALGPYPYDAEKFGGENACQNAIDVKFVKDEANLTPKEGLPVGKMKWQKMESAARVDLDTLYNGMDFAAAYAGTYIYSPSDMKDAIMYVGSDDYVKVYINGKLVHTYNTERRAAEKDDDRITGIELQKGWNRVVVKIVDVILDWEFYLRFSDSKGRAMKVSPDKP